MDSTDDSKKSFFKHVFNFDDDSKHEILNIIQYALLAIIPIILLNKLMSKYVPEADEQKGSLEVTAEIILQILVMFMGLLIIHRIITFIPTYSGVKYPDFHVVCIILAILMITMSLQTKLGEKVSILVDRIVELWDGKQDGKKNKSKQSSSGSSSTTNMRISQPISGQITNQSSSNNNAAITQSLYTDGTAISSLPITNPLPNYNETQPRQSQQSQQQSNASDYGEPVAANGVLGSNFGSSW